MLFANILKRLGELMGSFLQQILYSLCETTLSMIRDNYDNYPDFREAYFTLLQNIVKYCIQGLFTLEVPKFETMIWSIVWALKHTHPTLMELGLETMLSLISSVAEEQQVCTNFFVEYYTIILKDLLFIISDYQHVSGFKLQTAVLMKLLQVIEVNSVLAPLKDQGVPHQLASNKEYVVQSLIAIINQMFPNLSSVQIETFVLNLFNNCFNNAVFK